MKFFYLLLFLSLMFYSCDRDTSTTNLNQRKTSEHKGDLSDIEYINSLYETSLNKPEIIYKNNCFEETGCYIVFEKLNTEDNFEFNLKGTVFLLDDDNKYKEVIIDIFEPEGSNPQIETIFFYNVDEDVQKELIVLCSWDQQLIHTEGKLYKVDIYDHFVKKEYNLKRLNNYFDFEFEGMQEGYNLTAKHKDSISIKKKLDSL